MLRPLLPVKAMMVPGYYVLFQEFIRGDFPSEQIVSFLSRVMDRTTRYSFNFTAIVREYFGLSNYAGMFSLTIHPYEFSRFEQSYEEFKRLLNRI